MSEIQNRLNITSVTGYSQLLLQFNHTPDEMADNRDAFRVLELLLYNGVKNHFRREARKIGDPENIPALNLINKRDPNNFSIEVQQGGLDEKDAMRIVRASIDYALSFDVSRHRYRTDGLRMLFENNIIGAKQLADTFYRDIFKNNLVTYTTEYWVPFK